MEIFANTTEALIFAFRFSSEQYALSPMAKMIKSGVTGKGKGLVALDGAGQAGIIQREISILSSLHRSCIVSRYSIRYEDCKCCGNLKMIDEYKEAIANLAEWSMGRFSGISVRGVRMAIIQSFFEKSVSLGKVADRLNVPRRTAYDQKAKVWAALKTLDMEAQSMAGELLEKMCGEQDENNCAAQTCAV